MMYPPLAALIGLVNVAFWLRKRYFAASIGSGAEAVINV
jgi:hypothetical protein